MSGSGSRGGLAVGDIVLKDKKRAQIIGGKKGSWTIASYDDDGKLVRTMTFSGYQTMGGRLVPATMLVIPADKPDELTSLTYHELEFDIALDESFFSLRNLRSRR